MRACLNSPLGTAWGFAAGTRLVCGVVVLLGWWRDRWQQQRWRREDILRRQLREFEDQLWRERLPDWQRESMEQADRRRGEIRREARLRLGLPEEA
jgi:hypothetical protein